MIPSLWSTHPIYLTQKDLKSHYIYDNENNKYLNKYIPNYSNQNVLRIITFNIYMWNNLWQKNNVDEVGRIILELNSDIIILQEALLDDNIDKLKKLLHKYFFIKHNCLRGVNTPICTLIITKYPILDAYSYPITKTPIETDDIECQVLIHSIIKLPNNKIMDIFGVHLDVHDETENTRYNQINDIINLISKNRKSNSVIIGGDFNALNKNNYSYSEWEWIKNNNLGRKPQVMTQTKAIELLLNNGYVSCDKKNKNKYTVWSGRTVDHIFINNNFEYKLLDIYRYFTNCSDHLPVILDISLE